MGGCAQPWCWPGCRPRFPIRDPQYARLKDYIESHLTESDLSVESIADACGISLRIVHRAFALDASGSVSKYIWMRRISQCAAALQDGGEARPITDICYSWGFSSTSHFSRLFKSHFGLSPRGYRRIQVGLERTAAEAAARRDLVGEPLGVRRGRRVGACD